MNYLAHLALSGMNEEHMVGNFLGDLVPKAKMEAFSEGIRYGGELHRRIDAFTDAHPYVLEAKALFSPASRRYSGIILDIYFDLLLSERWGEFYSEDRTFFHARSYTTLQAYEHLFPERAKQFSQKLRERDLLHHYGTEAGAREALVRLDGRLKQPVGLDRMLEEALQNKARINTLFGEFFAEMQGIAYAATVCTPKGCR